MKQRVEFDYRMVEATATSGDTFMAKFVMREPEDMGYGIWDLGVVRVAPVVLFGCIAPEAHSKNPLEQRAGTMCRDLLQRLLRQWLNAGCRFSSSTTDRYGRPIGDLLVVGPDGHHGESLSEHLLVHHGYQRFQGTREVEWTEDRLKTVIALARPSEAPE